MSDRQMSPYPQQQIIYQQVVRPPTNGMAITSLVLGIVAIVTGIWIPIPILGLVMMFLAFLPAVLAVIFGHVGLRNATRLGGIGRGASLAGLILGYVTLGISVITTFLWIATAAAASSSGQ
ncbi:DUF4190 domain-containing protein [Cryobacterium sp. TMT4-10]|uniref:DUF4190 domain-containing protein n=1 Tax=Cryobacterium sp. TMT4-10 TaxID=1259256 RepID=UPI00106BB7C6|nr:DUF4190 domain-containing protein [Cryobacterium sp. TMT4-10]